MEQVLVGMSWKAALIFPGDAIIHAKSLSVKFERLRVSVRQDSVKRRGTFLGHVVSSGVSPSTELEKISAAGDWHDMEASAV